MAVIVIPERWQRQPAGPVEIDWNHGMAGDLIGAFVGGRDVDLCQPNTPPVYTNAAAAQQAREGEKVSESQLKPGDLVFFNTLRRAFSHVGIYIGNGQFIHSPRPGQTVRVENLDSPYWAKRFDGARRIMTGQQTEVAQDDAGAPPSSPAEQTGP